MIVFISQPMNGKSAEEIEKERIAILNAMEAELEDEVEVIGYLSETELNWMSPVACLAASISKMDVADLVIFAKGWEEARGCCIEHEVAVKYGLNYREV